MTELTCIIVDDEQIARETLRNYLDKYCEDVTVLAMCNSIESAKKAIELHQPGIVFLDIEMPYGDGFDLLEQLPEITFEVVFITAFSNYAIRALNMSATHYILKPVDIDELVEAVEKIRRKKSDKGELHVQSKILLDNLRIANGQMQRIVLPQLTGFIVVQVNTILFARAADNYTEIHLIDGKKHVVSKTLKFFEDLLSDSGFIRIHKSHLININEILAYKKGKIGQVKLSNGAWFDISLQRKKEFLERFK